MSNKIMDVRSCIDAAVSPEGLKTSGGGGGGIEVFGSVYPISLSTENKFQLLNPANASNVFILYESDEDFEEQLGLLSLNMAIKVKNKITSADANADGLVLIGTLSPMYPISETSEVPFCINGTDGHNYLGKIDSHYIYITYSSDIEADTILIFDTTPVVSTQS